MKERKVNHLIVLRIIFESHLLLLQSDFFLVNAIVCKSAFTTKWI